VMTAPAKTPDKNERWSMVAKVAETALSMVHLSDAEDEKASEEDAYGEGVVGVPDDRRHGATRLPRSWSTERERVAFSS
jgi:hypothetical protein